MPGFYSSRLAVQGSTDCVGVPRGSVPQVSTAPRHSILYSPWPHFRCVARGSASSWSNGSNESLSTQVSLGLGACVLSHEPLGPAELGFDVVCEFVLLGSVLDEYSHLAEKIVHCRELWA